MLQSTINKQQQVKQGRWGKMFRGLSGRGPTRVQKQQRRYSLSLHRNYSWDCRIMNYRWLSMQGLSCSQVCMTPLWSINTSMSVPIHGTSVPILTYLPLSTGYNIWSQTLTYNTGKSYQGLVVCLFVWGLIVCLLSWFWEWLVQILNVVILNVISEEKGGSIMKNKWGQGTKGDQIRIYQNDYPHNYPLPSVFPSLPPSSVCCPLMWQNSLTLVCHFELRIIMHQTSIHRCTNCFCNYWELLDLLSLLASDLLFLIKCFIECCAFTLSERSSFQ
jgi:hypothetical protein